MKKNIVLSLILISLVVVARLMPHVWNVAPVAAVALLAGVYLPKKWGWSVPLLAMFISDSLIGFYDAGVMLSVYVSYLAMFWFAHYVKPNQAWQWLGASLASSTFFFVVTNFAVWASSNWYEKSWSGLQLCYYLALPFFRNTMLGDLIYVGALAGAMSLVVNYNSLRQSLKSWYFNN